VEINRSIFPMALSLGSTLESYYNSLAINLMNQYKWTSVFILLDKNSSTINPIITAEIVEKIVDEGHRNYVLHEMTSIVNTTYADVLTHFRQVSRGD
jgi:hypothetical protein